MERQTIEGDPGQDPRRIRSLCSDFLGFEIFERGKGFCRLACAIGPHHLSRSGAVHGSVLPTLIDHAAGLADSWAGGNEPARFSITSDLNGRSTRPTRAGVVNAEVRGVSEGHSNYSYRPRFVTRPINLLPSARARISGSAAAAGHKRKPGGDRSWGRG